MVITPSSVLPPRAAHVRILVAMQSPSVHEQGSAHCIEPNGFEKIN
jgi:hypothetical protein